MLIMSLISVVTFSAYVGMAWLFLRQGQGREEQ